MGVPAMIPIIVMSWQRDMKIGNRITTLPSGIHPYS